MDLKKMFEFSSEFLIFFLVFVVTIGVALLLTWLVILAGGRLIDG